MTDDQQKSCAALSAEELKAHVRRVYSLAAGGPQAGLPFPVGREFAQAIGYPPGLLDSLPEECVASFAGIYPLSLAAEFEPGRSVLDVGCGAGLDALIAARRTSPGGRVVGVDFSEAMVARAKAAAQEANLPVEFQVCEAGQLPLPEASFDIVLANGVLNLNPDRKKLLSEMARVLKGGGRLYVAEIVSEGEGGEGGTDKSVCTLQDWFR